MCISGKQSGDGVLFAGYCKERSLLVHRGAGLRGRVFGTVGCPVTREIVEDFLALTGPMTVINLASRSDRRREFAAQLHRIGLSFDHPQVRLFAAIRPEDAAGFPTIGTRGCFLSHLGVLRQALAEGRDSVLICEDDLDFAPDMLARLPALTTDLKQHPWSLFYGGYATVPDAETVARGLARAAPGCGMIGAHFYAVRGAALADLVRYLEAILTRPPGDPAGGPMHVDGAISRFRADHPGHATLVASPPLGVQRASRTDIHDLHWFDRWPLVRDLAGGLRRLRANIG